MLFLKLFNTKIIEKSVIYGYFLIYKLKFFML